jgi:hypothetical protein
MDYALAFRDDDRIKEACKIKLQKFDALEIADQADIGRSLLIKDQTTSRVLEVMRDVMRNDQITIMAHEHKLQRKLAPEEKLEFVSTGAMKERVDEIDSRILASIHLQLKESNRLLQK